ncbi:class I SAM-dependent methyltransferase [Mycolicibacterium sp. CBMA 226]|uniref:class I SAM-dependent methyltransferase n=1 Tax=Mycolicibacterium sp. CBMA 226 TaxID=2606611 RepID=UPI0012DC3BC8|nr:class I SAM-dependent methyltransferase [Mycolicibacterium sp. CBMA 226]MUL78916.1 class I SAM-dependent methyltransferase [Mycolicibacterium sp. CBMA 226]QGW61216.1 Putative S-adenosyl-L-methionine-dependent methyltransferase [Mycolicibacterium sp.]
MPRTDNDSWDITTSVGRTALGVAAFRAAETAKPHPLFRDPFAQLFLDAAGETGGHVSIESGEAELGDASRNNAIAAQSRTWRRVIGEYTACRTAFFDEFFVTATEEGIRQAVILAAGLDARAWRLPWPDGTTVYEIDQPAVLEFKSATLRSSSAEPTCTHIAMPIDLRHDWPTALQQAGFDPALASAWSAEGLLPYLPAQAQDLLFDRIQVLSAAGSRLAVEALPIDFPHSEQSRRDQTRRLRETAERLGRTDLLQNFEELWYYQERTDLAEWLRSHQWDVSVVASDQLLTNYQRAGADDIADALPGSRFMTARRTSR